MSRADIGQYVLHAHSLTTTGRIMANRTAATTASMVSSLLSSSGISSYGVTS